MSTQVIHCKTQEEWNIVSKKLGRTSIIDFKRNYERDNCCINVSMPNCSCSYKNANNALNYEIIEFENWYINKTSTNNDLDCLVRIFKKLKIK